MKIICVGRNYVEHIKELNNSFPTNPVIFTKPDTSILLNNKDFYLPDFSSNIHHEIELIIKISKEGKKIPVKYSYNHYKEVAIGIDFTARDLQDEAKKNGLPWTLSKGFNHSAPISKFNSLNKYDDIQNLNFCLKKNEKIIQKSNSKLMIYKIDFLIHYISKFIHLKVGDIIFTGTPKGVSSIKTGDNLKAYLENEKLLDFNII